MPRYTVWIDEPTSVRQSGNVCLAMAAMQLCVKLDTVVP